MATTTPPTLTERALDLALELQRGAAKYVSKRLPGYMTLDEAIRRRNHYRSAVTRLYNRLDDLDARALRDEPNRPIRLQ